ncbi:hypothetical protein DRN94_002440 [archaeon]|nr:hypothetical protein [archaeon]
MPRRKLPEPKRLPLERLLSSAGKTRLLLSIAQYREITISKLIRLSRMNFREASRFIDFLKRIGLVEERRYGRVRIISIKQRLFFDKLNELSEIWESLQKT